MLKKFILKVVEGNNLSMSEAEEAMNLIMEGKCDDCQIASFLTALRMKKETVDEVTGFAKVMRSKSEQISVQDEDTDLLDTCGTGGDRTNTFNISTLTAFVAAGAGMKVAKHGNRSVSSKSGSADILSALGVKINLEPKDIIACINEVGIGFLFAQIFHKAMKYAAAARLSLGLRTVFNLLGPLTNPLGAKYQLMGVYSADIMVTAAKVLGNLGNKHAFVVHGVDGMDEVSLCAETRVAEYKNGEVREFSIEPGDFGFEPCDISQLQGGSPEENAGIALNILGCKDMDDPKRKAVLINASVALMAGNYADSAKEALALAEESLESGAALQKLKNMIEFTNSIKKT